MTDDEVIDAVEAEMKPGGRPIARYMELDVASRAPALLGQVLTTRILGNLEERIVALEEATSA